MNEKYNVYLVHSTVKLWFLSLKSQFANFEYEKKEFAFVRTEQQIDKIIKECNRISYIIYNYKTKLAKYMQPSEKIQFPALVLKLNSKFFKT